jgi:hypothetical protein
MAPRRQDPAKNPAGARPPADISDAELVHWRVSEPEHPLTRSLLTFWEANKTPEGLLERCKLPAPELKRHLPFLYLYEPIDPAGNDWRCRLSGSGIRERYGNADTKGNTVRERCNPELAEQRVRNYRQVCEARRPFVSRGRLMNIGLDFYEAEVVNMPILMLNGAIWVLGGMFFFDGLSD